jgi:oligoribonuclease NrnB/cAMP/cGMP phosphodiesterase (DHH superfamily)
MPAPISILFHGDCLDGFAAAYSAWRRFGDLATYRPMHHGEPWEISDIAGHQVFILDFSFTPDLLEEMATIAESVFQIDHHVSALKAWDGKLHSDEHGNHSLNHTTLPLSVNFHLGKSGARLAWEYFHPGTAVPLAILHIEDQDMWRFTYPETRAFCRALRLMSFDFAAWNSLITATADRETARYRETILQGNAIESYFQREVERLAQGNLRRSALLRGEPIDATQALRHGQAVVTDGRDSWLAISGLAINANVLFASELGNFLAEQSGSFGMVWQLAADGEVKVSLRSQGKTLDVSVLAARYGGGGHANAAGFRMPAAEFFSEVLALPVQPKI